MYPYYPYSELEQRWLNIDSQIRLHVDDIEVVDKDGWQSAVASLHQKSDALRTAFAKLKVGDVEEWQEAEARITMAVDDLELNYRIAKGELTAANAQTDKEFRAALDPEGAAPTDDTMHRDVDLAGKRDTVI